MDFIDPLAEQSEPVTPSLDAMALFVEIVRAHGFRRAAQSLGIPSSRISRRIAQLERSIGVRLLLRTTRRMELTEAGRIYFERCAPLVDGARLAHEQLAGLAQCPTGVLRASMPADYATVYLAPMLADFAREYPGIAFELDLSARRADLIAESLDVAIRTGEQPSSGLVARKIATEMRSLYAAPSYLALASTLSRPSDLAHHACIRLWIGDTERTWTLVQDERREEVAIGGRFRLNGMGLIQRLAVLGVGIALLPDRLAREDVQTGRLVRVLPDWSALPVPVYAVTENRLLPAKTQLFIDFLRERLQDGDGDAARD